MDIAAKLIGAALLLFFLLVVPVHRLGAKWRMKHDPAYRRRVARRTAWNEQKGLWDDLDP